MTFSLLSFRTPAAITNGIQITTAMVGPTAILSTGATGYPGNLRTIATPSRGFFRGDTPSEFSSASAYVYNNLISNNGGVVPGGGMVIDGYSVPAGVIVVQFTDFSGQTFSMVDSHSYMFRGCRFRGPSTAPGYLNCGVLTTGSFWVHFCEAGGNGSAPGDFCEVPFDIQNGSAFTAYRNRISFIGTAIQPTINNSEVTENYISDLTDFGNGISHLNGITVGGSQINSLILRNHIVIAQFDTSGRQIVQTDCISFFQDFGTYPGNGINRDGSTGYLVDNNYVGGTGYCLYAGKNAGSGSTTVNNMVFTNNLITTAAYVLGGNFGPCAAQPVWGTLGNVANNNTWVDGALVGQAAFGSGGIAPPSATTTFAPSATLATNDTNTNSTFRVLCVLTVASGGKIRATFTSSSTVSLIVNNVSICKWDGTAAPSGTTVPVELLFAAINGGGAGGHGFTIPANSSITSILTDHSGAFSLGIGDTIIVTYDTGTTAGQIFSSGNSNCHTYFAAGTSYNVQSPAGMTNLAGVDYCVSLVEESA